MDLPPRSAVLIAGAGGDFDFMCGLPIALELEQRGHEVVLASCTFTRLGAVRDATWHSPHFLEVTSAAAPDDEYFPERDAAAWYEAKRGAARSIWCFSKEAVPRGR